MQSRRIRGHAVATLVAVVRGASVPRPLASDHLSVVADLSMPAAKAQTTN